MTHLILLRVDLRQVSVSFVLNCSLSNINVCYILLKRLIQPEACDMQRQPLRKDNVLTNILKRISAAGNILRQTESLGPVLISISRMADNELIQ